MSVLSTLRFLVQANRIHRLTRSRPEKIARLQNLRLRSLLRFAAQRSPMLREHWKGIDLERCQLTDLPPLEKSAGMARFDDWVTDRRVNRRDVEAFMADMTNAGRMYLNQYIPLHTSGSQGQPVVLLQERDDLNLLYQIQTTRGNVTGGTGVIEAARKWWRPARVAMITMKQGFYPTAVTFNFFPRELNSFLQRLWLPHTDPDLLARLNEFSPTNLTAYASVLLELADAKEAGRLRLPHLKQLVNNSELLTDAARQRLQQVFGVPVMNNYAAGECMHLSVGCPTDPGVHINADWAILEVVDAEGRPVPPGQRGAKVYVTNLSNRIQPIIRYVINDAVTWATAPCRCGSQMPRLERIEGRGNDSLWVRDRMGSWRRLDPMILKANLHFCTDVLDWRVTQSVPEHFLLEVVPVPGQTVDEDRLRRVIFFALENYGFQGLVQVEHAVVSRLPPDPATGKVKRVICTTGPHSNPTAIAS